MAATRSIFIAKNSGSSIVPSTTAADYIETLITNESIRAQSQSTQSQLISDSRQPRDVVRTGFEVGGPINSEFAYGMHDHILEAALFSADWAQCNGSSKKVASATVEVNHSTKTIVATAASPFTGLAVGDWVRLEKSGYANTGICFRISTWTDADNIAYDSWTKTPTSDGSGVTGVTVRTGERIVAGNTDRVFTVVKKIGQAGATLYECILGAKFNGFSVSAAPGSILGFAADVFAQRVVPEFDGSFSLDSAGNVVASGGTAIALATYLTSPNFTAAPGNKVFSTAQATGGAIMLDGVPSAVMSNFNMQLQNNITGEGVLFYQGNAFVEPGNIAITGTAEAIFNAADLYTKFINDEEAKVAVYLVDNSTQGYIIDLPSVRVNDGGTSIPGQTGLVKLPLSFGATVDSVTSRALQIIRFDAS